jgi:hypothetical protein
VKLTFRVACAATDDLQHHYRRDAMRIVVATLLISLGLSASSDATPLKRADHALHVLLNKSDDGPCGWLLPDGMMNWQPATCAEIWIAQDPDHRRAWFEGLKAKAAQ